MPSYEIVIDKEVPLAFEACLFNQPQQVLHQPASEHHCFDLLSKEGSLARFYLFISGKTGCSPFRAPFGSVEFHDDLSFDGLHLFLRGIIDYCRSRSLEHLEIISWPQCYNTAKASLLSYVLLRNGFTIKYADLNFHLEIAVPFTEKLHPSEKRRWKKCMDRQFTFEAGKDQYLSDIHALLKVSRERKGFPVSMSEGELNQLFEKFPDDYHAFTLWDRQVLIASAIGVKVSSKILYYFLPADHEGYRNYSPTVLLLDNIHRFCREHHFDILDLGIATVKGIPNEGLIRFKKNTGGIPSLKQAFEKVLL